MRMGGTMLPTCSGRDAGCQSAARREQASVGEEEGEEREEECTHPLQLSLNDDCVRH